MAYTTDSPVIQNGIHNWSIGYFKEREVIQSMQYRFQISESLATRLFYLALEKATKPIEKEIEQCQTSL
jgi:hypothetical protein